MTDLGIYAGPEDWTGADLGGDTKNTLDVEQHLWSGARRFALQRHYNTWPKVGVNQKEKDAVAAGRNVYVEIAADSAQGATHAAIAAGKFDSYITAQGSAYKSWWNSLVSRPAPKFYFVYQHEADVDKAQGNSTDYKAAFKHFNGIWRSLGVPCLFVFNIDGAWSSPAQWEPDPASYDIVGADRYNKGPVVGANWRTFATLIAPAQRYAASIGKQVCVGETGCAENPNDANGANSKQQWFTDMGKTCAAWGNVAFVCYTHKSGKANYRISTSAQSIASFKAAGATAPFG
jgi:hypothetical protein